jgi:hypothetical protein
MYEKNFVLCEFGAARGLTAPLATGVSHKGTSLHLDSYFKSGTPFFQMAWLGFNLRKGSPMTLIKYVEEKNRMCRFYQPIFRNLSNFKCRRKKEGMSALASSSSGIYQI